MTPRTTSNPSGRPAAARREHAAAPPEGGVREVSAILAWDGGRHECSRALTGGARRRGLHDVSAASGRDKASTSAPSDRASPVETGRVQIIRKGRTAHNFGVDRPSRAAAGACRGRIQGVDLPGGGLARRRWRRRGRLAGPRPPGTSPWRPLRDEPVRSQARDVSSEVAATGAPCRRRWTATCRLRRSRGVPLRPSLRVRASCDECSRRPLPGCESAAA